VNTYCTDDGVFHAGNVKDTKETTFQEPETIDQSIQGLGGCDPLNLATNGFDYKKVAGNIFKDQLKGSFQIDPSKATKIDNESRGELKEFTPDQIKFAIWHSLNSIVSQVGIQFAENIPVQVTISPGKDYGIESTKELSIESSTNCEEWLGALQGKNQEEKLECTSKWNLVSFTKKTTDGTAKKILDIDVAYVNNERKLAYAMSTKVFINNNKKEYSVEFSPETNIYNRRRDKAEVYYCHVERLSAQNQWLSQLNTFSPEGLYNVEHDNGVDYSTFKGETSNIITHLDFMTLLQKTPNNLFIDRILSKFSTNYFHSPTMDISKLADKKELGKLYSLMPKKDPEFFVDFINATLKFNFNQDIGSILKKLHEAPDIVEL
jgi:hypothetical protein